LFGIYPPQADSAIIFSHAYLETATSPMTKMHEIELLSEEGINQLTGSYFRSQVFQRNFLQHR